MITIEELLELPAGTVIYVAAPANQGLMDFILLAMKVDDGFVQRGRIHGAGKPDYVYHKRCKDE
jgi:hypothetical protein